jgi:3',5'-cyclic AMP phosphodiesterase CpdA
MPSIPLSRRNMLGGALAGGLGLAGALVLGSRDRRSEPQSAFRIAHLTDLHVHAGAIGEVRLAVQHALSHDAAPRMIVTGGDLIYDAMARSERSVSRQWRQFHRAFDGAGAIRVEHIIGNHDIWGVNSKKCGTTGREPLIGKAWAKRELGLDRLYRSFDAGGWHWVLLDDVQALPEHATYEGRLDEEQFAWLEADLRDSDPAVPVVVVSHVPILSSSAFFLPQCNDTDRWNLPFMLMHADARRIVGLFERHGNVMLCLSGHTHLVDHVEYKGVNYLGNGAVCGNWWTGAFQGFEPGYGLVDLYPDGSFESRYCSYRSDPVA